MAYHKHVTENFKIWQEVHHNYCEKKLSGICHVPLARAELSDQWRMITETAVQGKGLGFFQSRKLYPSLEHSNKIKFIQIPENQLQVYLRKRGY